MITLCLIHGWATNAHIFDRLRRRLPEHWQMIAPNLAGHGDRCEAAPFDVCAEADAIAAMLPDNSYVLGWSLGGVVAQYLAVRHPQKVRGLILCATFAKLQAVPDYPEGVNNTLLNKMLHLFQQDYPKHMRQFLELQLLHSPHAKEILAAVLPDALKDGTPQGIAAALDAVSEVDTRGLLSGISCPTVLLYGGKDSVTPIRMGEFLARHLPQARLVRIDKAAHAPFLSHADEVAEVVREFVGE